MKVAELILLAAGALMLALYFGLRAHGDGEAVQGIAQFEQARERALAEPAGTPVGIVAVPALARPAGPEWRTAEFAPDHEGWADYRVRLFERDNAAATEDPVAVLRVPGIDLAVPVYRDMSERNLNRGVAHVQGTAALGTDGNVGIAGHRDSFFRGLQHVEVGDLIEVETLADSRSYRITELSVVEPTEVSVLDATESAVITLVTCYPFYFAGHAPHRYIVRAEAVSTSTH